MCEPLLFVDIDVIVDGLTGRASGVREASVLLELASRQRVRLAAAGSSWTTVAYLIESFAAKRDPVDEGRRLRAMALARQVIADFVGLFEIIPADRSLLEEALASSIPDFEDAIQYTAAKSCAADYLITNDARGFPLAEPPSIGVVEWLQGYSASRA